MGKALWFVAGAVSVPVVALVAGLVFLKTGTSGFSARAQPTRLERLVATQARAMALPAEARERRNPVKNSDEVLAEARAHWADHCASCHGNDGSGQTEMGQHMYPPAPDMRQQSTQRKTDGEIFHAIENGIRLSGMPAWGGSKEGEQDSWKLVHFIRHLPSLSQKEIQEMEELNPKTPEELAEEQEEGRFLRGEPSSEPRKQQHHH